MNMMRAFSTQKTHPSKRTLEPRETPKEQSKISNVMAAGANRPVPQAEVVKIAINSIVSAISFPDRFSTSEKRMLNFGRCNRYRLLDSAPARLHRGYNSLLARGENGPTPLTS